MTFELLTSAQMGAIRELGVAGMVSDIAIYRQVVVPEDEIDPQYDYGDDQLEPGDIPATAGFVVNAKGWFVSRQISQIDDNDAQIGSTGLLTMRVPVGTDIDVHDVVLSSGRDFVVIDTHVEDTWPEWLRTTLREHQ